MPLLPQVVVLGTGGTIAGAPNGLSDAGYTSASLAIDSLLAAVPGLDRLAALSVDQVASVGGQSMTEEILLRIAARVSSEISKDDVAGVVVTHGTDTLEETAFFLSKIINSTKPVIITGATRPAFAPGADGPANIYAAVSLAAHPDAFGRGVMVVFDGAIISPRDVIREKLVSGREFGSSNAGAIGFVSANGPRFLVPTPLGVGKTYPLPNTVPFPRVEVIYSHINATADLVNAAIGIGCRGIVLAGTGNGNSSPAVIEALADAVKQGILVVRASRVVGGGSVERNIEVDDDHLGFVAAGDLDTAKARILAQLLIANEIVQPAAAQAAFDRLTA